MGVGHFPPRVLRLSVRGPSYLQKIERPVCLPALFMHAGDQRMCGLLIFRVARSAHRLRDAGTLGALTSRPGHFAFSARAASTR